MKTAAVMTLLLVALATFVWATDSVTLQGERTIYTAKCVGGAWVEDRCNGKLEAAKRYRFRALKSKGEVVYWIAGSEEPSGKLSSCAIQDGRNWTCKETPGEPSAVAREMRQGFAVLTAGSAASFRAVQKWRWFLLRYSP
jgi:hypothetical protein